MRLLDAIFRPLSRLALRIQRRHRQCADCRRWFSDTTPSAFTKVTRSPHDTRRCSWCHLKRERQRMKHWRAMR